MKDGGRGVGRGDCKSVQVGIDSTPFSKHRGVTPLHNAAVP